VTFYSQLPLDGNYQYADNADCQANNGNHSKVIFYDFFEYSNDCYVVGAGGIQTYQSSCSDKKIKTEIQDIANALDIILKLEPVEFDWNETFYKLKAGYPKEKKHSLGFIAQEVEKILPEVVEIDLNDGYYKINYPKLNAVVVEGIKAQQIFIDDINKKIEELENLLS